MSTSSIYAQKNWHLIEKDMDLAANLASETEISHELAEILAIRGIKNASEAKEFLNPDISQMHSPFLLDGIEWAANRIKQAIEADERIMIHGDFDVDGITATALQVRMLRILNANVSWYIPHRENEGYDLSKSGVNEAIAQGVTLIITVDCGTSALEAVQYARDNGIDIIITDHHEVGDRIAPANVVINPHKPNSGYPFKWLAGVGVSFKLAEAVASVFELPIDSFRQRFCDLAALGTRADIVPLIGENRVLVKCGLDEMPRTGKKGLKSLINKSKLTPDMLNSESIAFILAPRLNAAGRFNEASLALELLLTSDDSQARDIANQLETLNNERQKEQSRIMDEAIDQIIGKGLAETSKVLVLSSSRWHPGIIGIVAAKITKRFCRPSILIAMDESYESGVGSARSIKAFNIYDALCTCNNLLDRFGGHSQAAGLSISGSNLDEFKNTINALADDCLNEDDLFPTIDIDCEIPLCKITKEFAAEIELLEPTGHDNNTPVFLTRNCRISQVRKVGRAGNHLKLSLRHNSGIPIDCIAWGWGEHIEEFALGSLIDVCYNIKINNFNGYETVQMVLIDARASCQ